MTDNYDDIINLPHHVSKRHPQMSMWNRAAQFAPFSALTGYEDAINNIATDTASGMVQSASAVQEVSRMAQELRTLLGRLQK